MKYTISSNGKKSARKNVRNLQLSGHANVPSFANAFLLLVNCAWYSCKEPKGIKCKNRMEYSPILLIS